MENHVFLPVQIAVSLRGLGSFVFQRDGFAGIVLNISFFDATEEGGILFLQKNLQLKALPEGNACNERLR